MSTHRTRLNTACTIAADLYWIETDLGTSIEVPFLLDASSGGPNHSVPLPRGADHHHPTVANSKANVRGAAC